MAFISAKAIRDKRRYYLEQSVRLPGGKVRKFSRYLKGYRPGRRFLGMTQAKTLLQEKVHEALVAHAAARYRESGIFDSATFRRLEEIKLGYAAIRRKLTPAQLRDVIDRFAVNFTYESNAIEGNSLTLKDVTLLFQERQVWNGKDLREVYETLNAREALRRIFARQLRVRERDIIHLHAILVRNTGVRKGYKRIPNFLLGKAVRTTPPERVAGEMRALLGWHQRHPELHPLQRAASFHGKFERIHPFEDGNGRVGRLLINIMLLQEGYPPLIIRKTQRRAYLRALETFDNGQEVMLSRFLVEKYKQTYGKFFQVYVKYLDK